MWLLRRRNPRKVSRTFRMVQTVSAAALALGHGLQDAQKTMGVIFLALVTTGHADAGDPLPIWVVVLCRRSDLRGHLRGRLADHANHGPQIIDLDPAQGFTAETVGSTVLYITAYVFAAPISTTHAITSAIMGAAPPGACRRCAGA